MRAREGDLKSDRFGDGLELLFSQTRRRVQSSGVSRAFHGWLRWKPGLKAGSMLWQRTTCMYVRRAFSFEFSSEKVLTVEGCR